MVKDYMYLFAFYHRPWATILLTFSITFPISIMDIDYAHSLGYDNITFAHNMLNFFGIACDNDDDKLARADTVSYITTSENLL